MHIYALFMKDKGQIPLRTSSGLNSAFYQYGGHIELIQLKEYYGMPRGGMSTFRLYFWALFRTFFLKVFLE